MRGAAIYLAEKISDISKYDGLITSNMISLSDLKALLGEKSPPLILYFHENQILYPLAEGEKEDLHYGFTDITSSLCADYIIFNSHYHKDAFIKGLKPFISRFPDYNPYWVIDNIIGKSGVLYPGCQIQTVGMQKKEIQNPPLIIWNHRWEHDKNPADFFSALFELEKKGIAFRLAVLGEQYKNSPPVFNLAKERLHHKIVHFGYLDNYNEYKNWLLKGDIIISTSNQENFGISIVEAIGCGNFPLLPARLSYRELIPEKYHKLCIYKNQSDLVKKLIKLIHYYDCKIVNELIEENYRFSWKSLINEYDEFFQNIKKNPAEQRD